MSVTRPRTFAEQVGATPDLITCQRLADDYDRQGLRPILDPLLELVRRDCTHCHAQDSDPQRMWRPVVVVPRGNTLTVRCDACSYRYERSV
jgi:hypothetical protein